MIAHTFHFLAIAASQFIQDDLIEKIDNAEHDFSQDHIAGRNL